MENKHGSAPGIWIEDERGRWVAMLPGVPREMRGMLSDTLLPILRERVEANRVVRSRTLRTTGVAESLLADRIGSAAEEWAELLSPISPMCQASTCASRCVAWRLMKRIARLKTAVARLRPALGDDVYGEGEAELAAIVIDACRSRGMTIAVAESCTGGCSASTSRVFRDRVMYFSAV